MKLSLGLLTLLLAAGCATSGPDVPTQPSDDPAFTAAWDATHEVLRQYNFRIDRADRREGVITTHPLLGRHWFEFWRPDAATRRDVAESTLQTIHRRVTVQLKRDPNRGGAYSDLAVKVQTSRSDQDAQEISSVSQAFDMFLHGYKLEESEMAKPDKPEPIELGQDPNLERVLAAKIRALSSKYLTAANTGN